MNTVKHLLTLSLFLSFTFQIKSQEYINQEKENIKLGFGLNLGHTWIPTGENFRGERDYVLIPSWGMDIILEINEHWGLVLANDIQMQRFLVKTVHEDEIEREYPISCVLEVAYKTDFGMGVILGPGVELEKSRNFFVYRIGLEYAIPINKTWFVKPSLIYEMKEFEYSILNLGLGIGFLK